MTTTNTKPASREEDFRKALDTFVREAARGTAPSVTRDTLAWYVYTAEDERNAALERERAEHMGWTREREEVSLLRARCERLEAALDDAKVLADEQARRLREANRDTDNFGAEADALKTRNAELVAALRGFVNYDDPQSWDDLMVAGRAALAGEG